MISLWGNRVRIYGARPFPAAVAKFGWRPAERLGEIDRTTTHCFDGLVRTILIWFRCFSRRTSRLGYMTTLETRLSAAGTGYSHAATFEQKVRYRVERLGWPHTIISGCQRRTRDTVPTATGQGCGHRSEGCPVRQDSLVLGCPRPNQALAQRRQKMKAFELQCRCYLYGRGDVWVS